jgi:D-ribose pyranose/furanose isomerase RbsD
MNVLCIKMVTDMDSEQKVDKLLQAQQIKEHNLDIIEAMKKLNERIQHEMNTKLENKEKQIVTFNMM